jgi:molybdopterin/thiamine biosynthesis adenylyltransferase
MRETMDRYHRQKLLPFIGEAGQEKLQSARVLLIGCGALGSVVAEQLARAGVGHLVIVDRDVVERTNLQRQVLFAEADARGGVPKAVAAAERLAAINSSIVVEPNVTDVHVGNIETLAADVSLIVDGTDNAETRYLLNDVAVKHGISWIYGACVGTDGRMMTIRPGNTACLRCVFPEPPGVGELQTCDTAGVLGPAIAVIAGYQAAAAIKILSGHPEATDAGLLTVDFWKNRHRTIDIGNPKGDCPCCGQHQFQFLDRPAASTAATLCGRNSVQVRPAMPAKIDLKKLAERLAGFGKIESSPYLLRSHLNEAAGIVLTIFPDGRCIVQGTEDLVRARTVVSQFVGT